MIPAVADSQAGIRTVLPSRREGLRRLMVLSAAYPSPAEPQRGVFIENLNSELIVHLDPPCALTVVAPRVHRADPTRETRRRGVRVLRFRYPGGGRRLKELARPGILLLALYCVSAWCTVMRASIRRRPDVMVAHWVLPMGLIAAAASLFVRCPFVVFAHGSDIYRYTVGDGQRASLQRWLAKWTLRRAHRVFAVSRELEEILWRRFRVPLERLRHLPMGVDERYFGSEAAGSVESDAATHPSSDDESCRHTAAESSTLTPVCRSTGAPGSTPATRVLFVGDLVAAKGVAELVQVWRSLAPGYPGLQLCFLGDGPLAALVKAELDDLIGTAQVLVCGRVEQKELASWYRSSDLLVLPSHSEGTPVVVLEALSCGLPVVATRVGGIPEVVADGKTGRIIPPRSPQVLEMTLKTLLVDSPSLLATMRQHLRTNPPRLGARVRARQAADELRRILEERAHGV